jgi:hypothetical protein
MRVTIVVENDIVTVDGQWRRVDCSPLIEDGIHAVQWYETVGEVEFRTEIDAERKIQTRKPNEVITDFSPYQSYVDAWEIENAKQSLIEAAQQKEMADNEEAAAKLARQAKALMKLPQAEREQLFAAQQAVAEQQAAQAEQQRLEAWEKLSPDEQRQVIADASP